MRKTRKSTYQTITGREFELSRLSAGEREFLAAVQARLPGEPEWSEFAAWWLNEFKDAGLPMESVTYRICQDLESRLGIAEGKVAPPDYRDYLADLIEEFPGRGIGVAQSTGNKDAEIGNGQDLFAYFPAIGVDRFEVRRIDERELFGERIVAKN